MLGIVPGNDRGIPIVKIRFKILRPSYLRNKTSYTDILYCMRVRIPVYHHYHHHHHHHHHHHRRRRRRRRHYISGAIMICSSWRINWLIYTVWHQSKQQLICYSYHTLATQYVTNDLSHRRWARLPVSLQAIHYHHSGPAPDVISSIGRGGSYIYRLYKVPHQSLRYHCRDECKLDNLLMVSVCLSGLFLNIRVPLLPKLNLPNYQSMHDGPISEIYSNCPNIPISYQINTRESTIYSTRILY